MNNNYTVYHLHSEDSLLDSCTNYKLYIDKACELGQNALAFTEHGNIMNWFEKYTYCSSFRLKHGNKTELFPSKEKRDKFVSESLKINEKYVCTDPIKYIHGVECYLTEDLTINDGVDDKKIRDNYHTVLLAKNIEGMKEINLLIDKSTQDDHFYYKPRITFTEFFNISNNVIKISACLASPLRRYPKQSNELYDNLKQLEIERRDKLALLKLLTDDDYKKAKNDNNQIIDLSFIEWKNKTYNDIDLEYKLKINELQKEIAHKKNIYDKLMKCYDYYEIQCHNFEDQIEYNKFLYEASKQYNKPLIVGTDTHSLNNYKAECRNIIKKSKESEYSNEDKFDLTYKSYEELIRLFKVQNSLPMCVILQALENTNIMANSISYLTFDTSVKYPILCDDEESELKKRISQKLQYKLDNKIIENNPTYKANIKEELRVFKKINMIGFMLFMSDLVCWCWDNDIPIGFCRGSVGGSTVAYITDIIDVDPVKWNTVFSRFANEDREEVGDIDIDIPPSKRDLVYKHIIYTFTIEKTAYILANGTISDKGTIDEIGRALSYTWIDENFVPIDKKYDMKYKKIMHKKYANDVNNPYNLSIVSNIKCEYDAYITTINACKDTIKSIIGEDLFKKVYTDIYNDSTYNDDIINKQFDLNRYNEKSNEYILLSKFNKALTDKKQAIKGLNELKTIKYKQLFYYFEGLLNTEMSQSIHPAGIVVSPISLPDNYGTFWNDGKRIISLNMDSVHECGLVKYDLLGLKNIEIIDKACKYANLKYPKSYEINWNDKNVWNHICDSPVGIFQFESKFAYDSLKKYGCKCINDLSLVNSAIRPSGTSYRDRLLNHEKNHNPSKLIDDLLSDNNGFLVFQEDTIKFLKDICGLSGSDADNVRRAIGRKQLDRLQKALPQILEGYCKMSPQPREVAEQEAKVFLKIIEDSSNYQFGYNHSTGYSMIGYMCGYYRYYYPEEFISAYLNCSDTQADTANGISLAKQLDIKIYNPKFRKSNADYTVDKPNKAIYKGIASIKFLNSEIANKLYNMRDMKFTSWIDFLKANPCGSRETEILIKLDYFSEFGKSARLLQIYNLYQVLTNKGKSFSRQIKKDKLPIQNEDLIKKYATSETEKQYQKVDIEGLLNELFESIPDDNLSIQEIIQAQQEYLGYIEYTNPELDQRYIVITELDTKYSPKFKAYCLKNGQTCDMKVKKEKRGKDNGHTTYFKDTPFENGDILYMKNCSKEPSRKLVDGEWTKDTTNMQWWINEYQLVKMGNFH